MVFSFRETSISDTAFYAECFRNDEFRYMIYKNEPIDTNRLDSYVRQKDKDLKFVGSVVNKNELTDIGFAHFYYNEENTYTYVGGIHPNYFNRGYGIYASIAMLALIYDLKGEIAISTGIFKHNVRSLKADLAIGFTIIKETEDKYILALAKNDFNNRFVNKVKQRISYYL